MNCYDVVIIGGGIVGLSIAREFSQRDAGRILIIEKEPSLGLHASGRNSGVLHSGIYYSPDSMKAKLCAEGARLLAAYADERGIRIKKNGKVIVATHENELPRLRILYERGLANGIRVERISEDRLKAIEPEARTIQEALYSPDTAVIDSAAVLLELEKDLCGAGVQIEKGEEAAGVDVSKNILRTNRQKVSFGHLVNAAGLHADRVAHWFGAGQNYSILPFKGIYKKLNTAASTRFRGSIYPVPDLMVPFLGVHITRTMDDSIIVGPTAMPVLGRENYKGLNGIWWRETPRIVSDLCGMVFGNRDGLGRMIYREICKYLPSNFFASVQALAPNLKPSDFTKSEKVGIRAQLVNRKNGKLVMDFVVENGPHSTHVLNAVSPAFTSSFAFAEKIVASIMNSKTMSLA